MGLLTNIHTLKSNILGSLRQKTHHIVYDNHIYNWSLNWPIGSAKIPTRFITSIPDPWQGDTQKGDWICEGDFEMNGQHLELHGFSWQPYGAEPAWSDHMHSFTWLRDLRSLGGEKGRSHARAFVHNWITHHPRWDAQTWNAPILGKRLCHWISMYDFFGASGNDEFQHEFFESILKQAKHLSHTLGSYSTSVDKLHASKGLAYAGIALDGREHWLEQGLTTLKEEIDKQILSDGGHISRSPANLFEAIHILVDMRHALLAAGYPIPPFIQHGLDRMVPALRFFRTANKKFSLFNGTQQGDDFLVDAVLLQANIRAKTLKTLPQTGYERINLGRSQIIFDTGAPPKFPYDTQAHAAPLSFELSYGKEQIITNCGAHPTDPRWNEALRNTAAHSTLSLDDRNACEIMSDNHFSRRCSKIVSTREEWDGATLVEAMHDGYVPLNGITHRRKLYMCEDGHDLRGEDTLNCSVGLNRDHEVSLRFHLHPRVIVSLIRDDTEALIRLTNGAGWRFMADSEELSNVRLSLEDSIYLGDGARPQNTKQLVVTATMHTDTTQIKWALQREGLQNN